MSSRSSFSPQTEAIRLRYMQNQGQPTQQSQPSSRGSFKQNQNQPVLQSQTSARAGYQQHEQQPQQVFMEIVPGCVHGL